MLAPGLLADVIAALTVDEDEVLHAYQDSEGFWTIGIGTLIDKRKGGGITHEEALYLCRNRVESKAAELDEQIPWWSSLAPELGPVLLNMAFNMGVDGLLGFHDFLAALEQGDRKAARVAMLDSKWARTVGARATRLANVVHPEG